VSTNCAKGSWPCRRERKRAKSPHRDSADRHAASPCVEAPDRVGNGLLENVGAPAPASSIMEVAVIASIEEHDDRGLGPQFDERLEECVTE
jgi:hypothetical protein